MITVYFLYSFVDALEWYLEFRRTAAFVTFLRVGRTNLLNRKTTLRVMGSISNQNTYSPFGRTGGILTGIFLFLTAFYGTLFFYFPLLPLMILWPWLFRRSVEVLGSVWQTIFVSVFEKLYGMKVVVTGDSINRHEKTVVLLNHRTRLDWLYFMSVVFHMLILNRQKIALKSMLKQIPGIGWGMQVAGYIFLDRNWETDQDHIDRILSYFVELESKPNILFFPEGTDLSESNKRKSMQYAEDNNLPQFEYVLHPRTKGFTYFVNTLRNVSGIHAVHDVTVAYPYNIPTGEMDLLQGEVPREVHFNIKRYSIHELPEDTEELTKWCQNIWAEKELLLRKYYSVSNPSEREFKSVSRPVLHSRNGVVWLALFVWCFIFTYCTYLLYTSFYARCYVVAAISFFVFITKFFGEFAKLEMACYEFLRKPKRLWGRRDVKSCKIKANLNGKRSN